MDFRDFRENPLLHCPKICYTGETTKAKGKGDEEISAGRAGPWPHQVQFVWVKGHDGHPENERCDALATGAADGEDLLDDTGL